MDLALDLIPRPTVTIPVSFAVIFILYHVWNAIWPFHLPKLPVVGSKESDWFPLVQARWRNSRNYRTVTEELRTAYKDRPCLVPIGGSEVVVMLPASETQRIASQPDSVLNMPEPMIRGLQMKYTVHNPHIMGKQLHVPLVRANLTHQISNLMAGLVEDAAWGFETYWGCDAADFKEVPVYDSLRRVIGSVTNRAFVGLPACRNSDLLEAGMGYAAALPQDAKGIRLYPEVLKPWIARFYTKSTRAHTNMFHKILLPEIEKRIGQLNDKRAQGQKPEPNDFLQWSIKQALNHPDPRMKEPATLTGRILMVNFGSIHSTSFTITHAIFDLYSSKQEYVDELREEVVECLANNGGEWKKEALNQMRKLDSTLRESLRLDMPTTFGVPRLVVGRKGYASATGLNIPAGNTIAVAGKNICRSDEYYEDAETYRPFRFSEVRSDESVQYLQRANLASATTDPTYLPFGHGKHACPGRFFAINELKLLMAYILIHYEVEMMNSRPQDIFAGVAQLPPLSSKIRIRRRG